MGERDSSLTRVLPVFNALAHSFVPRLVRLVAPHLAVRTEAPEEAMWHVEKALRPPKALLKWLVDHPQLQPGCSIGSSTETIAKRQALMAGDISVRAEAHRLIDRAAPPAVAWYVLEGPSYPDVYIQTPELIMVVEGKRTESKPTRHTSWMPMRDQLLRHIDCAWEIRGDRRVMGVSIVEGDGGAEATAVPSRWQTWLDESRSGDVLAKSLPHRSPTEQEQIASSVLGVTTWQRVCEEFSIDWASLPDRVD
jgi:hypothetical protein